MPEFGVKPLDAPLEFQCLVMYGSRSKLIIHDWDMSSLNIIIAGRGANRADARDRTRDLKDAGPRPV